VSVQLGAVSVTGVHDTVAEGVVAPAVGYRLIVYDVAGFRPVTVRTAANVSVTVLPLTDVVGAAG
jgi:hypothetical protein